MARPERFELPTPKFVAWCSIQLSYGRVLVDPGARHPWRGARREKDTLSAFFFVRLAQLSYGRAYALLYAADRLGIMAEREGFEPSMEL